MSTDVLCHILGSFNLFHAGILDQGQGVLIVFEDSTVDQTYTTALETISSMGKVVDSLYSRAKGLH